MMTGAILHTIGGVAWLAGAYFMFHTDGMKWAGWMYVGVGAISLSAAALMFASVAA